jgi:hypothetical protein
MTKKKVLPPALPQSTDETPAPAVAARPKRSASVAQKPAAKLPKAASTLTPKPAGKSLRKKATPVATAPAAAPPATAPAEPSATPAAAKTSSRSPAKPSARSSARPATHTKTRKPARVKTNALPPTPDQAPSTDGLKTEPLLPEQAVETTAPQTASLENMAAEKAAPATVPPPVVNDAELWEQDSPIRSRIAQLRTRNSLLEEQLQRLRPPFQVRGKKK